MGSGNTTQTSLQRVNNHFKGLYEKSLWVWRRDQPHPASPVTQNRSPATLKALPGFREQGSKPTIKLAVQAGESLLP